MSSKSNSYKLTRKEFQEEIRLERKRPIRLSDRSTRFMCWTDGFSNFTIKLEKYSLRRNDNGRL